MTRFKARIWMIGGLAALAAGGAQAGSYGFQIVDDPADPTFNQLLGINNAGTAVGYYGNGTVNPNRGYTVAAPYTGGGAFTNENFPGSFQTQVTGINNAGVTVGFWVDGSGANYGFVEQGGTFTTVANPAVQQFNQLLAINDSEIAAGFYTDVAGNSHGYTYNVGAGTFTSVTVAGFASVQATAINNAGTVAGTAGNGASTQGFIDAGGIVTLLNGPAGSVSTAVFGLNNLGYADGFYTDAAGVDHGFLYDVATQSYTTIDAPNASKVAGGGTVLNGLNDVGQLTGYYMDNGGFTDGLLVTTQAGTIPEPGSVALVGLGLAAAAIGRRRRHG